MKTLAVLAFLVALVIAVLAGALIALANGPAPDGTRLHPYPSTTPYPTWEAAMADDQPKTGDGRRSGRKPQVHEITQVSKGGANLRKETAKLWPLYRHAKPDSKGDGA